MNQSMLNESLRLIRIYWGKTQVDLSSDLGISQSYLSDVENGKKEVTIDLLNKYSRVLDVPMSSLLLFAENIDGHPPMGRTRMFLAGKALKLLRSMIPDELHEH